MTTEDLKILIREIIQETLEELTDSDEGMTLKADVREYLIELQDRKRSGTRGIPAKEIYAKLGLDW